MFWSNKTDENLSRNSQAFEWAFSYWNIHIVTERLQILTLKMTKPGSINSTHLSLSLSLSPISNNNVWKGLTAMSTFDWKKDPIFFLLLPKDNNTNLAKKRKKNNGKPKVSIMFGNGTRMVKSNFQDCSGLLILCTVEMIRLLN